MTATEGDERVRYVIDLWHTPRGVSGSLQRQGSPAVRFESWLELLSLLESPVWAEEAER